ncbi:MAG: hypothetical protein AB7D24_05175 [Sphaerochaeta sp.]|jgi:hypothetical protein|uniref:hypothetical protein n=1 Tax=unclassified Sphaerochaeta TaxID=2637943 RepID=UPI0025EEAC45|nr:MULTISPECIES: hypothetical protein [unclassified Sphaerochaeta]MCK9601409.1 hypothetical protein [Sphaerochaeta sp.]MDX9824482.1 hypothetical protein [Sphaerochaeta sp.]
MRKNTRDTIRRPKDWERDPAWDSDEQEVYTEEGGKSKTKTKTTQKEEPIQTDIGE